MKRSLLSRRDFLSRFLVSGRLAHEVVKLQAAEADTSHVGSLANDIPALRRSKRQDAPAINRAAVVKRHNPVLHKVNPLSPFTLGNGEFAFTADITGLQTFPLEYEKGMPLCTMSQWGWHTSPPPSGIDVAAFRLTEYDTYGRTVGYPTQSEGQSVLYRWLRENPHRLHLGQIGLRLLTEGKSEARASDLSDAEQRLDLWSGILSSRFVFDGRTVVVKTSVHPIIDSLAVIIESPLINEGRLAVRFSFPYGSPAMQAADWTRPERHITRFVTRAKDWSEIHRVLDSDQYFLRINWGGAKASLSSARQHVFLLTPQRGNSRFDLVATFSPRPIRRSPPSAASTFAVCARHWESFWSQGAAVELAESRDRRAPELERRVVLSQYLTAVQCAGTLPPQETGLTVNSWSGKFHLEMHWWHAAHFALWHRLPLLERSLGWYDSILPSARAWAAKQGYAGARWPKMTSRDGRDSPSPIGPLLIWQQPHPISYAELCYRARPVRQTLERYRQIVFETADFMASFAVFNQKTRKYSLGPPLIPAQENHPPRETWNPTFELSYWRYGLELAQRWRERLGLRRHARWDHVIKHLAPLPMRGGVYLAHENCPQTYAERNRDHPSMLAALGMLPGDGVDRETMRRTLYKVRREWKWDETWGWDYPLMAMTAARLGETELAVDALVLETEKNRYLPNGHNPQRPDLPCYLPGNGGLLYAVAMMAGGWDGGPQTKAPGFPADGSWRVRWEKRGAG